MYFHIIVLHLSIYYPSMILLLLVRSRSLQTSMNTECNVCYAYRNFGLGDKNVKYELKTMKHQRNEVVMTVGKHTVQVACKNKRDGKQRAAQAILQVHFPLLLHFSWRSSWRLLKPFQCNLLATDFVEAFSNRIFNSLFTILLRILKRRSLTFLRTRKNPVFNCLVVGSETIPVF